MAESQALVGPRGLPWVSWESYRLPVVMSLGRILIWQKHFHRIHGTEIFYVYDFYGKCGYLEYSRNMHAMGLVCITIHNHSHQIYNHTFQTEPRCSKRR